MKVLFSEDEAFYRSLGLKDEVGYEYEFNGLKLYNKNLEYFSQYDCFVCAFFSMPHNAILTDKFRRLKIKTVLCSDGIFEFSNAFENPMLKKYGIKLFHPILQDCILIVGKKEVSYFSSFANAVPYMPNRIISKELVIPRPSNNKTLITTANTAYFNDAERIALQTLLLDIISKLDSLGYSYAFRIFDDELWGFLVANFGCDIYNDVKYDFETTLEDYSSVITTPSSIVITAMYHQRAVGILVYRDYPLFLQSGWLFNGINMTESSLKNFISLSPERIDIQNRILADYLTENDLFSAIKQSVSLEGKNRSMESSLVSRLYFNMLNSKFNFNIEYFARKVYLRVKYFSWIKKIRKSIRW
ncbi:hypothetical protein ACS86_05700 [Vibrio alginolyticus]|nr:hypothetical protein ACS86_05700 [Vibrio alginolyticus]